MTAFSESSGGDIALTGGRAVAVGKQLASAGESFLGALKTPIRTSTDLVKAAGVNKDIAGRFLTALAKRDPVAVVYYMPGVESLRRLTRGAKSRTRDPATIEVFETAIADFEQFLRDELGGRHALDAMASALLPEARERFESTSRQMAFRAAANLRGIEAQAILNALLVHPCSNPDRHDAMLIHSIIGVQRLRPSVPLNLATFDHRDDTAGHPTLTLDGRPICSDGDALEFLPQFGRAAAPALNIVRAKNSSFYQLVDESLGVGASADLFFGQYIREMYRYWARFPGDIAAEMEAVEVPAQRLVIDVLLHPDVWPGVEPELMFYNTAVRGTVLPYDRSRDFDRIDLLDTVRQIGTGIECCRAAEVPRYIELLEWSCKQRGWDPSKFRVYRCDARHPVVGVQYIMGFRLKERPEGA